MLFKKTKDIIGPEGYYLTFCNVRLPRKIKKIYKKSIFYFRNQKNKKNCYYIVYNKGYILSINIIFFLLDDRLEIIIERRRKW